MNKIPRLITPSLPANSTDNELKVSAPAALLPAVPAKPSLFSKIGSVATFAFKALAATSLYWINPSLFAIGFFAGIACDSQAEKAIGKINRVWLNQPWIGTSLIAFACALSLPVSLAAGALLMGAHLGSSLSLQSGEASETLAMGS